MLIYLIGYMGSGKTTIGKMLARRMGMAFADMDSEIVRKGGMTVSEIFEREGEDGFRRRENEALAEISGRSGVVVATGGGAPCFFDNMEVMNSTGLTIYLKMCPEKLAGRLEHSKTKRPLIKNKTREELIEYITENLINREPFYSKAKITVDGDRASDEYIANHVEMYINNYKKNGL